MEVIDGKIQLGEIDLSELLYIDSEGMKELIGNLIEYALARDSFRSIKK